MKNQQRHVIEEYVKSYNDFDVNGMIENLSESIIFENISGGAINLRTEGIEAFKEQALKASGYFMERKQTITNWDFNGSIVSVEIDYKAKLAIELPNGLKPGDVMELQGKSVFKFLGERITAIQDIT